MTFRFHNMLLSFFALIGVMIICRAWYSGELLFVFLVWNIFLAWLPFVLSGLFSSGPGKSWKDGIVFILWLSFFPNSLYIITDLIHLQLETGVPKWFDAILLFLSSTVGLLMAYISLFRVERFLEKLLNIKLIPFATIALLFLGSFGVYLGRFLRWNSWDIIGDPLGLFSAIGERLIYPFDHLRTWGITFLLTMVFCLLYFSVKKLPSYLKRAS